jgi:glycosyltransferase involved in cell wall biosynthesis
MPARIHYDVTDILEYARHNATLSGIQRVSTRLLSQLVDRHGTERLRVIAWHPIRKRMLALDASYFAGDFRYDQAEMCRHFGLDAAADAATAAATAADSLDLHAYLARKYGHSWRRPVHHARLLAINALTAGRTFRKRKIVARPQRRDRPIRPARASEEVSFGQGDVVLVMGATWNFDDYLSQLARARRQRRIAVVHFIHDLVPLLAPEHVVDGVPAHFARWLRHLSRNADCLLTNSQATRRDLEAWLAENGLDVPTRVLPLAHQFGDTARRCGADAEASGWEVPPGSAADADAEPIRAHVRNAARLPYALCVGTIESRKNVWTLANVWRRIQARLGAATPRLVFAGKHGWLKEDFDDFIRGTGSLSGYIRIVECPSDAELAFLYRGCLFSVYPSYKEGWGLPVGESLWLGRPVVCSNASSLPEVGGPWADYVDPASWDSIEAGLARMITDADYRERRAAEAARARLRTWADVADELWQTLTALALPEQSHALAAPPARPHGAVRQVESTTGLLERDALPPE